MIRSLPFLVIRVFLFSSFCCLWLPGQLSAQERNTDHPKFSASLKAELSFKRDVVPAYVVLDQQVNARKVASEAARRGDSKQEQANAVVKALMTENTSSQQVFLKKLEALDGVTNVKSRWIVNLVGFTASEEQLLAIADMPEVAGVFYDSPWEVESAMVVSPSEARPNGREPGHTVINADVLWRMGYTGFGGLGFTADTGVDPYHPALNHKYAGFDGRPAAWYGYNANDTSPYDCDDHGSHVTGTIMGLDRETNDTIGVAPRAHWLGGAILCGLGTVDNIGAFQWAIDPDGDPNTFDDRPTVINNSWRDPSVVDECATSNPYPIILDNMLAAGLAVVFSAGNSGPEARSITPPHNYNTGLVNAFTIGALNGNSSALQIADFSSRGPALCLQDSTPLDIKPEVSAPGQSVRSSIIGGGYANLSGTSMAAPHVSGSILLLHEAFPDLTGEELQLALYFSARDLGDAGEDNTYGRGIIDVEAAYNYLVNEGNVPVPPSFPSLAPMATAFRANEAQCGGQFTGTFLVRNDGTERIESLIYETQLGNESAILDTALLSLDPGQTGEINIEAATNILGTVVVQVRILAANNQTLDPRLDLGGVLQTSLSPNQPMSLTSSFDPSTLCKGSPVVLNLSSNSGQAVVPYFSANPNPAVIVNDPLAKGPFVVENLSDTTTLYGMGEIYVEGGLEAPLASEVTWVDGQDVVIRIRPRIDMRIRSFVLVSPENQRVRMNFLDIDNDESIGQLNVNILEGLNRVPVNRQLLAGINYEISFRARGLLGLLPNERVANTTIANVLDVRSITGDYPDASTSSGFFFDWNLGFLDGCPAQEITLIPDTSRVASQLSIVLSDSIPSLGDELVLSEVTVNSGNNYTWLIDGVESTGESSIFTHTVAGFGTQKAYAITPDESQCLSVGLAEFTVSPAVSGSNEFAQLEAILHPNPASERFFLQGETAGVLSIQLLDQLGRIVRSWPSNADGYALSGIAAGSYQLILQGSEGPIGVKTLVVQ